MTTDAIFIRAERAYVFHGYSDVVISSKGRSRFTLHMRNCGRTLAGVKGVWYKFCKKLPLTTAGHETWTKVDFDLVLRPDEKANIATLTGLSGRHYFVSCIKYQDFLTMDPRYSFMGMELFPDKKGKERTARAGGDYFNKWN